MPSRASSHDHNECHMTLLPMPPGAMPRRTRAARCLPLIHSKIYTTNRACQFHRDVASMGCCPQVHNKSLGKSAAGHRVVGTSPHLATTQTPGERVPGSFREFPVVPGSIKSMIAGLYRGACEFLRVPRRGFRCELRFARMVLPCSWLFLGVREHCFGVHFRPYPYLKSLPGHL